MRNLITNLRYAYQVYKTNNGAEGKPLSYMTQYYLKNDDNQIISFWNDVPISLDKSTVNTCVEIPKEHHAKFEVIKQLPGHPYMQDTRKNLFSGETELRYYAQFPLFNYGYIPQTWEQSIRKNQQGLYADDDPIDILDLSKKPKNFGDIFQSRVLGGFCLIDQGEIDWKIFTIDIQEAEQQKVQTIADIDPRLIQSILNWFKVVKVYDGKAQNKIGYNGKIFNQNQTMDVIKKTHEQWNNLMISSDEAYAKKRKEFHIR